jgi:spore maturation protein CgeB
MVMYESIEDMYEKAGYYLANPELSEDIALRGHDKVLREYGYDDRIKTMLQTAGLA